VRFNKVANQERNFHSETNQFGQSRIYKNKLGGFCYDFVIPGIIFSGNYTKNDIPTNMFGWYSINLRKKS